MPPGIYPKFLDFSKDESASLLREYELEAYSSVVTAFRAQVKFQKQKKTLK